MKSILFDLDPTKSNTLSNRDKNTTKKTKLFFFLFSLILFNTTNAQQQFCSLVSNGAFVSTQYNHTDPFKSGKVTGWIASHGTPLYNFNSPMSDSASPQIEAAYNTFTGNIGSGIRTSNKIAFYQGLKYYIVFNYRNDNGVDAKELNVALVADAVWGTPGNTLPIGGLGSFTQIGTSIQVPGTNSSWTKKIVCFTAPYSSADLWFFAKVAPGTSTTAQIGIENVEIYQDFDFAGSPKVRFLCDETAVLGLQTTNCNPLNALPTHTWYISGSNAVIANTQSISVLPSVTTTYVLARDNGACITFDTVKVMAAHKPYFTLGPDTTICQCEPYTLDPGIRNNCYSYVWNDGYVGVPRIIKENSRTAPGKLSQIYTLTVTDNCSGCSITKSVTINFKPVPNCKPRTKVFCEGEFPQSITTKGIGTSYSWSWDAAVAPSAPYDGVGLVINSIGTYVCKVTDANGTCTYGFDTITVYPWDSMQFDIIANQSYSPCDRKGLYLVNTYEQENPIKWYKDGVYVQTSVSLYTSENGLYTGELLSPYGFCSKVDSFQLTFIDPPIVNLSSLYGSYCRNGSDTVLDFTYCDTCTKDMGHVTSIKWSGNGVIFSNNKYYYSPSRALCGNNLLTATIVYTKYNIICTTYVNTNAYKICPLVLDSVLPLCAGDGDVYLYNQGALIANANIYGNGVYQENGTKFYKFSPKQAGAGLHTIRYYYSDSAGCNGWDSIKVKVLGKPTVKLWAGDCNNGAPTWNVLVYAAQAEGDVYTLESSEWNGASRYGIGYNSNFATTSFWGSTKGNSTPGHTYWFKVTNSIGCYDSVALTIGQEKPIHLTYDATACISKGVPLTAYYNSTLIDGNSYPGNIAYIWDNDDTSFISTMTGNDKDYATMMSQVKTHPVYGSKHIENSAIAKHKVFTIGWHRVRVLTFGGCEYTDSIFVPFECGNCKTDVENIVITTSVKWSSEERVINGNLIIEAGGNLEINNCNIHFTNNSRVIVKNNYASSQYSGTLTIINSTLDGCSNWKGIEVWGSTDLYDYNAININLGDDPRTKLQGSNMRQSNNINTTHSWAWVYAVNSVIKDADIAIFVGKYDNIDDRNYSMDVISGGMAFMDHCTFKNNYVDVVFTPRPGAELISGKQAWNASYVVNCTFDSLRKSAPTGTKMYWCDANGTTNPQGKTIINQSATCHIVDLTETLFQDQTSPMIYWAYTGNGFGKVDGGMYMVKTTLKRDARIPYTLPHAEYSSNPMTQHLGIYSINQIKSKFQNTIKGSNCNDW